MLWLASRTSWQIPLFNLQPSTFNLIYPIRLRAAVGDEDRREKREKRPLPFRGAADEFVEVRELAAERQGDDDGTGKESEDNANSEGKRFHGLPHEKNEALAFLDKRDRLI